MWFVLLFNVAALALVAPVIHRDRERRSGDRRTRELVDAGAPQEPERTVACRPQRRTTEDVRAEQIYLSWLVKRDALHG